MKLRVSQALGNMQIKEKIFIMLIFSVYHAAPHFFDDCLKLVFALVNTFEENSLNSKR